MFRYAQHDNIVIRTQSEDSKKYYLALVRYNTIRELVILSKAKNLNHYPLLRCFALLNMSGSTHWLRCFATLNMTTLSRTQSEDSKKYYLA